MGGFFLKIIISIIIIYFFLSRFSNNKKKIGASGFQGTGMDGYGAGFDFFPKNQQKERCIKSSSINGVFLII